jgi:hypothetical protein
MSAPGRPKREFPLGGTARSAKGATSTRRAVAGAGPSWKTGEAGG